MADPIRVIAFGSLESGPGEEKAFTVIKFLNRRGAWKRKTLPSAIFTTPRELITKLAAAGYVWPPKYRLRLLIIAALSIKKPVRDVIMVEVPGQHGKYYVLPDESYGPKGPDRKKFMLIDNPTVKLGQFRRSGTLQQWKRYIGRGACIHSSRARLAMAASFAAPNLRLLNINSFGINFSGPTSSGKTFLLRLGLSCVGLNREPGPDSWNGSDTAFEQRALGHRDCIMSLDDLSHLEEKTIARVVTMRLAGNRPKARAGQYAVTNDLVDGDWRVIALSTSEDVFWGEAMGRSGQVRGEEVRMINVRACVSEMGDIFDGLRADKVAGATLEQRIRYVEKNERLALKYQGEAFRTYLTKRAMDKCLIKRLNEYISDFVDAAPVKFRWLGRIRRYFAVIYASAYLAINYGVLPWNSEDNLKSNHGLHE